MGASIQALAKSDQRSTARAHERAANAHRTGAVDYEGVVVCSLLDLPRATFFRFFFDRNRACSSVHSVTTTAIASGTRIVNATSMYSSQLMGSLSQYDTGTKPR